MNKEEMEELYYRKHNIECLDSDGGVCRHYSVLLELVASESRARVIKEIGEALEGKKKNTYRDKYEHNYCEAYNRALADIKAILSAVE